MSPRIGGDSIKSLLKGCDASAVSTDQTNERALTNKESQSSYWYNSNSEHTVSGTKQGLMQKQESKKSQY